VTLPERPTPTMTARALQFLTLLLALGLSTSACESQDTSPLDASADQAVDQAMSPDKASTDMAGADMTETTTTDAQPAYARCDQIAAGPSPRSLANGDLDDLLRRLQGSDCQADLRCGFGPGTACCTAVYSVDSISCQCVSGKFSCRDLRQVARGCEALRTSDGGPC
jgi:hypothetical protein